MLLALLAECIGTTLLLTSILILGKPILIASVLLLIIYAFNKISGSHLNPAVSLMMLLKGNINLHTFIAYVIAQLIGATLAIILYKKIKQ